MSEELEYRYDTQLLIEGEDLDEDELKDFGTRLKKQSKYKEKYKIDNSERWFSHTNK